MAREQSEAVREKLAAEGGKSTPISFQQENRHLARCALAVLFTQSARDAKSFPELVDVVAGALGRERYERLTSLTVFDLLDALRVADLVEAGIRTAEQT